MLKNLVSLRNLRTSSENGELATTLYQIIDTARSDESFAAEVRKLQ